MTKKKICVKVHNTSDTNDTTGGMNLHRRFPKAFRSSEAQKYKSMPDGSITLLSMCILRSLNIT